MAVVPSKNHSLCSIISRKEILEKWEFENKKLFFAQNAHLQLKLSWLFW